MNGTFLRENKENIRPGTAGSSRGAWALGRLVRRGASPSAHEVDSGESAPPARQSRRTIRRAVPAGARLLSPSPEGRFREPQSLGAFTADQSSSHRGTEHQAPRDPLTEFLKEEISSLPPYLLPT